jgi:L-asparaginase / beta-aspartyl-peptidase
MQWIVAMPTLSRSMAILSSSVLVLLGCAGGSGTASTATPPRFMLVVHGGVGTILRADMTPEQDRQYRDTLQAAISRGYDVLNGGGTALDAVVAVITKLEDSPLFNAGKGAVFTDAGTNELDASIMDGATGNAGAVAGVTHIKNPILLARLVMEQSPHVMLAGRGAEAFALQQGMDTVPASYFYTERRYREMKQAQVEETHGTVGAVALDSHGNLAAATSTGGITNKHWGRVGDSPIIGAGTYANNASCAVSGTGQGEFFIRNTVAHDICARVQYLHETVAQAAEHVINEELVAQKAEGGVVVLDPHGNFTATFNTSGMYRGWVGPDGKIVVKIYKDE